MYTVWDETPLKWHKFMTFFLLPIGVASNLVKAIIIISDPKNWIGILAVLNAVDLIRFIGCAVLGAFAVYGCLPSRRRWYGPKCAIALYSILAAFGIYNNVAGCALDVADSYYISLNLRDFISFSLTAILMIFYYRKRRSLFSTSRCCATETKDEKREHEQNTEDSERIWFVAENIEKQRKKEKAVQSALIFLTIITSVSAVGMSIALYVNYNGMLEYKEQYENVVDEKEALQEQIQKLEREKIRNERNTFINTVDSCAEVLTRDNIDYEDDFTLSYLKEKYEIAKKQRYTITTMELINAASEYIDALESLYKDGLSIDERLEYMSEREEFESMIDSIK